MTDNERRLRNSLKHALARIDTLTRLLEEKQQRSADTLIKIYRLDAVSRLQRIAKARDHLAEHGHYPRYPDGPTDTQCFDDWAADLADEPMTPAEHHAERLAFAAKCDEEGEE